MSTKRRKVAKKHTAKKGARFVLVFQFPGISFDQLLTVEERMMPLVDGLGEVDGHDFGSGEGNIFVITDDPVRSFEGFRAKYHQWFDEQSPIRVAFRPADGDKFKVLFPPRARRFVLA